MRKDPLTLERIKTAHPRLRGDLDCIYDLIAQEVHSDRVMVRFSDVLRTKEQQNQLYKKGRSLPGNKVTWVKGGYSYHNYGMAVDIVLLIDTDGNGTFETASWDTVFDGDLDGISDWLEVAKIFQKFGWTWGLINSRGRRYDLPHFQYTFGKKTSELKQLPVDSDGYVIISK